MPVMFVLTTRAGALADPVPAEIRDDLVVIRHDLVVAGDEAVLFLYAPVHDARVDAVVLACFAAAVRGIHRSSGFNIFHI